MKPIARTIQHLFLDLRQIHDGVEFWSARETQDLLGFTSWTTLKELIQETISVMQQVGDNALDHIIPVKKVVTTASGTKRTYKDHDFLLTRYAWHLLLQLAPTENNERVLALKTYFAKSLAQQDEGQQREYDEARVNVRELIVNENKKLFSLAKAHGVKDFSSFNNAGYMGLYGMRHNELVKYKGMPRKSLLDRAGLIELTANLSRIRQTSDTIIIEQVQGQKPVEEVHYAIGKSVREEVKQGQGILPENLPPEVSLKMMKKKGLQKKA